ncbi:hypothetical protein [Pseudomonas sp. ZS1P83]
MTIDKQKLKSLLWAEAASFRADCAEWERNTEALEEFLGAKTLEEVALELLAENEDLGRIEHAFAEWVKKTEWVQQSVHFSELGMHRADVLRKRIDQLKSQDEALNSIIEDLERARVASFEEYDFSRLKDRKGDQKVFEITIGTECGCDIEEGEYTVRVTHLLGNWLGSDDFGLIGDAVAEVIADLGLPEEGHTTFIAYESGERQDVFWTKWFEIATVASVLAEPDAAMSKEASHG